MGFEGREPKPNRRHRVLKLGTRVRPLKLLDRVVAGRVRANWAGRRVRWIALIGALKFKNNFLAEKTKKLEVELF